MIAANLSGLSLVIDIVVFLAASTAVALIAGRLMQRTARHYPPAPPVHVHRLEGRVYDWAEHEGPGAA